MRFALQRCAISHPNFKKWSEPVSFFTFWLANVLRGTALECNIFTSALPKVVPPWCVLYLFTWKRASRHSGVQFFISSVATWFRTRRFSEPTFRPNRTTNHWKNTAFRDFPNISRACVFFLLTFAELYLLSSDSTSLVCFSSFDSTSLLCFSSLHIVGSLTSKLPSIIAW